jgi:hypothetical protein
MKTTCTICKKTLMAELKHSVDAKKVIPITDVKNNVKIIDAWCPECKIKYRI